MIVNSDVSPVAGPTLFATPSSGYAVEVAWSGSDYVAVVDETTRLRRVRLGVDARTISDDLVAEEPSISHTSPRLAIGDGGDSDAIVVWTAGAFCGRSPPLGEHGSNEVAAAWIGSEPHTLSLGLADEIEPMVAAGAGPPLIVWNDVRDRGRLRGVLINSFRGPPSLDEKAMISAAVATNGSEYLVAYETTTSDCSAEVVLDSIDANGGLANRPEAGSALPPGAFPTATFVPAVAWNGSNEYLIAWQRENSIVAVKAAGIGSLLDAKPITLWTTSEPGVLTPRIAWAANHYVVVVLRSDMPYIPLDSWPPKVNVISLMMFDRRLGQIGTNVVLTSRGYSPAVASDGTTTFIAWRDSLAVHCVLLDGSGRLGTIADAPFYRDSYATSLSAAEVGGQFYLLDLDRLLAFDGTTLRELGVLPGIVSSSAMTTDRGALLVAWSAGGGEGPRRIMAARVSVMRTRAVR
jgi:hypothetical protein